MGAGDSTNGSNGPASSRRLEEINAEGRFALQNTSGIDPYRQFNAVPLSGRDASNSGRSLAMLESGEVTSRREIA